MSCAICEKRPPKRFCPAMGEKICAICCGEQREVSIDCPVDCSHLIAAHRYEAEHRKPTPPAEYPYRGTEFSMEFIYQHRAVISGIAATILGFQIRNKDLTDSSVFAAIEGLAETYRTLGTGIIYERPPEAPVARALYAYITEFLQNFRKQEAERSDASSLKDSEVFRLLVFILRIAKHETNERPRSRAFLGFLRAKFPRPTASAASEGSRIIMP